MTPKEFENKMESLKSRDCETAHERMDDVMCGILIELGYEDGVKKFNEQTKWYA